MPVSRSVVGVLWAACGAATSLAAQQPPAEAWREAAPKLFLDCPRCSEEFVRTEITFVNYVRDRQDAQIHLLITTQGTGAGGTEYTLAFIGQADFRGMDDTLRYVSRASDTEDMVRTGLVGAMKRGLVRYLARTPLAERVSVGFDAGAGPLRVMDKWNYWVFSVRVNSFIEGESLQRFFHINGNVGADRVTPEWKMTFGGNISYSESRFDLEEGLVVSPRRNSGVNALVVNSLGEHWSLGLSAGASSSSFNNTDLAVSAAPAVEYDLYPYSQSTRRQLRFQYRVGWRSVRYSEETIFDKTKETLFNEDVAVILDQRQKWGTVEARLEGSHYFHDFSKNHLRLSAEVSLRLVEGLTLGFEGGGSRKRDQLSLPKRGATTEEILTQRRELASSYNYFGSIRLTYRFGSIYNNVVNPRFGR